MKNNIENIKFSVFPCGWKREDGTVLMHQLPQQTQTIGWCYHWITSPLCAVQATIGFRAMYPTATKDEKRDFKILNFQYATFSCILTYRNSDMRNLVARSPFITIDIDHLGSLEEARELQHRLCADREVRTALCFISPSGLGLKWIAELPPWTAGKPFKEQFELMRDYTGFTYGYDADPTGSDVCRACFLAWDPECYVDEKYL